MTTDFLKKIVEHKKQIVVDRRHIYASIQEKLGREKYTNYHLTTEEIHADENAKYPDFQQAHYVDVLRTHHIRINS